MATEVQTAEDAVTAAQAAVANAQASGDADALAAAQQALANAEATAQAAKDALSAAHRLVRDSASKAPVHTS